MSAQVRAPATRPLRLGFVGLGWIGRARLDAIATDPRVEVAALAEPDAARLGAAAQAFPRATAGADYARLLDADLDGVVIATPSGLHADQAVAALERGLPVFCQKPLAIDGEGSARVVAAAERADRRLGVDFCYRHVAGMTELRGRVLDGTLGEIRAVDLVFHNAYGPDKGWCFDRRLAGGGCVLDLGVHLLDLAAWLQASPECEVVASDRYAQGRRLPPGDPGIEDLAFATLRQENGACVRLACSWHAQSGADAVIGLRLMGTRGGAVWRNVAGSFFDFELGLAHGARTERLASPPDAWGGRALADWVERLADSRRFDAAAHDYARVARTVDAIYAA